MLCAEGRPDQVTLVPDSDAQLTSDHGFDPVSDLDALASVMSHFGDCCGRVSLFVDSGETRMERFAKIGAQRVELYTGPFAQAFAAGAAEDEIARCAASAVAARAAGLAVNAGHDLNQRNLGALLDGVSQIAEVSIGHALIGEALYAGLADTVRAYVAITKAR